MKYSGKSTKIGNCSLCGYELQTDLQGFTQKDLTEVKILQKVLEELLFRNTL